MRRGRRNGWMGGRQNGNLLFGRCSPRHFFAVTPGHIIVRVHVPTTPLCAGACTLRQRRCGNGRLIRIGFQKGGRRVALSAGDRRGGWW